jgi:hypothetical protein
MAVNSLRQHLRPLTWLALVAVLALALLPTLSRAWDGDAAASKTHPLVEVCTAEGLKMVPSAEGADEPSPAHHADAFERCAHCVLGAAPVMPLPAVPVWQPADLRAQALPPLYLQVPHTLHAWACAQPRAPPVRS